MPGGVHWKIKEVTILGTYFDGIGPAASENVVFYRDRRSRPGHLIAAYDVVGDDNGQGDFVIPLRDVPRMKPGHYWMSVQTNQSFANAGEWGWRISDIEVNKPSVFRNPGGGFGVGCLDWTREKQCIEFVTGDHLFSLAGRILVDE